MRAAFVSARTGRSAATANWDEHTYFGAALEFGLQILGWEANGLRRLEGVYGERDDRRGSSHSRDNTKY